MKARRATRVVVATAAGLAVAGPAIARAHGAAGLSEATAWAHWPITPEIAVPTALVVVLYLTGMARRPSPVDAVARWRHGAFLAGIAALFLALQSPLDPVAERLFFVHQIQHLLLRLIGPMLIALAAPQGVLIAGLPVPIRRTLLAPVAGSAVVRAVFAAITGPVVVTGLFVGALYVWELPRFHQAALADPLIHQIMHASMVFAGVVFWWRIFDRRPAPQGLRYGVRLMMLWLVILSNIVLGALTTFKTTVLYPAYDLPGRLFGYAALADERIGGIIIWIPGSMMCVLAVLLVIHVWGRRETRLEQRQPERSRAVSGAAVIAAQAPRNRALALGFAAFAVTVFAVTILLGMLSQLSGPAVTEIAPTGPRHAAHLEESVRLR